MPYRKQGFGLKPGFVLFFSTELKLGVIHVTLVTQKVRISAMTHISLNYQVYQAVSCRKNILFIMLVVPTLFFGLTFYQVIIGFLVMHYFAGLILSFVFQLAHTIEGTSHPLPDKTGTIESDWAVHQMNTTVDFSRHSRLLSWYVGGLNFQVEHHLFPRICHIHYPKIANTVKTTAEEFKVPYMENKTFLAAIESHFTTLKRFGRLPDLNEITA